MPNIKSSVLSVRKDAKTNLIHKNAAARYKSNLAK